MRKLLPVALSLVVFGFAAMAQTKVDTKWHCPKASTEHQLDVGDTPDHVYWIGQGSCSATASKGGLKEKSGQFTEFHDQWKASFNFHGRYNSMTESGDTVYYTYEGTSSTDTTKPVANKWKIVSGTGKYKGVKGTGSCSGKFNADSSVEWECMGTYSAGK